MIINLYEDELIRRKFEKKVKIKRNREDNEKEKCTHLNILGVFLIYCFKI